MANTFLGYEVASPERQRKTALTIIGVLCALVLAGTIVLFVVSRQQQSGRELATATIVGFETKCRYVVRNISRRASYYDHTGYIDCDRAHQVAKDNNSVLGSVQRATLAVVDFIALDGSSIRSHVELSRSEPFSIGERVAILYRIEDPRDLREYVKLPFGVGKKLTGPAYEVSSAGTDDTVPPTSRPSDAYSKSTLAWVGLVTLMLGVLLAYWLIKGLYRVIRWLVSAQSSLTHPIKHASTTPIGPGRLDHVTRRASEQGFGRRRP